MHLPHTKPQLPGSGDVTLVDRGEVPGHSTNSKIMVFEADSCAVFRDASPASFAFSVAITFGIFISYLPQYWRIYRLRTSEGLSVKFLLLGSACLVFTLTNIILVSADARECCRSGALTLFDCASSQTNAVQIGIQCTCALLILIAVLVWTRRAPAQDPAEYSRLITVGHVVIIHGILSLIQVFVALLYSKRVRYSIATVNGVLSTILTVVKYVPQIATTYSLKHAGTLSVNMMFIQTPGGMIFTATLFATKGSHWSSWIGYAVALILQGTLLALCVYYTYFEPGAPEPLLEEEQQARLISQ